MDFHTKKRIDELIFDKDKYIISLNKKYKGINYSTHDFKNCIICRTKNFKQSIANPEYVKEFLTYHSRRYGYDYCFVDNTYPLNGLYRGKQWDAYIPLSDLVYSYIQDGAEKIKIIASLSELEDKIVYRNPNLSSFPYSKTIDKTTVYVFSDKLKYELFSQPI